MASQTKCARKAAQCSAAVCAPLLWQAPTVCTDEQGHETSDIRERRCRMGQLLCLPALMRKQGLFGFHHTALKHESSMGGDGAKGCRRWAAAARPGGRVATEEIELRLSHQHSANLILLALAQIRSFRRPVQTFTHAELKVTQGSPHLLSSDTSSPGDSDNTCRSHLPAQTLRC